ncbi:hypothetical protein SETIT_3G216100v2 [Setaria italica]|uniref:Coatomer subunit zeta n=6 Tax=Paniceae TaxID=147428 RepID=K3Z992_SETIT|nr:hypothetical protein SETIT_3G216100v2 [Setaria italica]
MQLTPISMKGEQMRTMSTNKLSAIVRTASPTPFSAVLPPATPTTVALSSHPPHRRTRPPLAMETCPSVKNILLLDSEGKRVAVKYYSDDWPTLSAKLAFEKSVFAKTQKANAGTEAEIVMFDGQIVVYKFIQDLHFFVTGGEEENELILASVLQGFSDAVDRLLKNMVDKRTALENLDLILLCLDEIVDGGIVLETEGREIAEKVTGHGLESASSAEQTLVNALTQAREHLAKSLLM